MEHLQHLFDLVRECRDDRQERGWAVRDDLGTIAGHLQELLKLLVRTRVVHEGLSAVGCEIHIVMAKSAYTMYVRVVCLTGVKGGSTRRAPPLLGDAS